MKYELIALIVSISVFVTGILTIYLLFGILPSISDTYYKLEGKHKWIFTIMLWGFAIPILFVVENGLMFFACSGICFVGTAPLFKGKVNKDGTEHKNKTESAVHSVGAISGIVLAMAAMWFEYDLKWILITMVVGTILLYLFDKKTHTWWIEILAFVLIIIGLIIKI